MIAARLYESVAFDEPTGTADSFGGTSVSWTERHACRAEIFYGKGDESLKAARQAGRKAYKLRIRSCTAARSITEDYRMRDVRRSTVWNVTEVDAITERSWIYLVIEGPVID